MQLAAHGTILQHDSIMPLVKTVQPSRSAGLASTLSTLTQEQNINNHVPSVIILLDIITSPKICDLGSFLCVLVLGLFLFSFVILLSAISTMA